MSHKLLRLTKNLYNTPHLITQEMFNQIEHYLSDRNDGEIEIANLAAKDTRSLREMPENKIGAIYVEGVLTYKSYFDMATCTENTSYQSITSQFDAAVKAGYQTIVMVIDSPGGEAYGAFETGKYLRSKADELGIRLISYIDGLAASGGYVLASAAHEVVINPFAQAGSIGVVVSLINQNKMLDKMGIERTYVYAGDNKIPFNSEGGWREEFISDIQSKVTALYSDFVSYVSEMMSLEKEDVVATQASVFLASDAKERGLVHSIMNREEFNSYLKEGVSSQMAKNDAAKVEAPEDVSAKLAELQAAFEKEKAEMAAQLATAKAEAEAMKLSALVAKASAWSFAGVDASEYASSALSGSISVEMFDAAMAKAEEALKEKDASISAMKEEVEKMQELGISEDDEKPVVKVDGVDAALAKKAAKSKTVKIKS